MIAALFLVPPAAAVGAFATLVALAVAVPVATVLSVSPGPTGSVGTAILGVAVTVAYFVAMVAGAIAVWRPRPDRSTRRAAATPERVIPPEWARTTLGRMQRRHDPADISAAAQEYLLALRVMGSDGRVATTAQLGRHVGVTTQAASEMCRRLAADGLSSRRPAAGSSLTAAGRAAADAIFRRHALLEWLLTSVVGLTWAESDVEAMRLQGALSPRVESKLDELLGHPDTCPHGNPIDLETARRRPAGHPAVRAGVGLEGDRAPDHRGGRGGRRAPLVPRGQGAHARART